MHVFSPTRLKVASLTLLALILWLGGFGCSLCCATGITKACCLEQRGNSNQMSAPVVEVSLGDASSSEHSCCQLSTSVTNTILAETILRPVGSKACSLLPTNMVSTTKLERPNDGLIIESGITNPSPSLDTIAQARTAFVIDSPLPLNRGGTYLRCGVLLI
jgi:hypothetical protein